MSRSINGKSVHEVERIIARRYEFNGQSDPDARLCVPELASHSNRGSASFNLWGCYLKIVRRPNPKGPIPFGIGSSTYVLFIDEQEMVSYFRIILGDQDREWAR